MSFASILWPGQLPEKPWGLGAVGRLIARIFICVIVGALIGTMIRYFDEPQRKALALFLIGSVGSIACFAVAIFVLRKPWSIEKNLQTLIILLLSIYGGFFLMWLMGRQVGDKVEPQNTTLKMILAVLSFQGAALVLVHFFLREHRMNWKEGFGLNKNIGHALLLGLGVGVLALPIIWGLQSLSIALLQRFTLHPHEQETVELLRATETWSSRFVLGIATIVIAPAAEETIFRGILYPAFKRAGYPRVSLWGTAILFGLIHANLGTLVPLTFLALVLTWLYEYTGNLLACFTVHSFFNLVNFAALYLIKNNLPVQT